MFVLLNKMDSQMSIVLMLIQKIYGLKIEHWQKYKK